MAISDEQYRLMFGSSPNDRKPHVSQVSHLRDIDDIIEGGVENHPHEYIRALNDMFHARYGFPMMG